MWSISGTKNDILSLEDFFSIRTQEEQNFLEENSDIVYNRPMREVVQQLETNKPTHIDRLWKKIFIDDHSSRIYYNLLLGDEKEPNTVKIKCNSDLSDKDVESALINNQVSIINAYAGTEGFGIKLKEKAMYNSDTGTIELKFLYRSDADNLKKIFLDHEFVEERTEAFPTQPKEGAEPPLPAQPEEGAEPPLPTQLEEGTDKPLSAQPQEGNPNSPTAEQQRGYENPSESTFLDSGVYCQNLEEVPHFSIFKNGRGLPTSLSPNRVARKSTTGANKGETNAPEANKGGGQASGTNKGETKAPEELFKQAVKQPKNDIFTMLNGKPLIVPPKASNRSNK